MFSVNRFMHQVARGALTGWFEGSATGKVSTVGVRISSRTPTSDWLAAVAVLLAGHRLRYATDAGSNHLLSAFLAAWKDREDSLDHEKRKKEELFFASEAVIATVDEEERSTLITRAKEADISASHRLFRPCGWGMAVIDGEESEDEREGLAEDCLLHGGRSCRSVRLLWAPAELDPDPYFEALAAFRAVFPVHPEVPGTLQMNQAFLEAQGRPHAYGEGLEFLVSRGAPEPQQPGHLRWVEYDELAEVETWLDAHGDQLSVVVAREHLARTLSFRPSALAASVRPGGAHRRPLEDQREVLVGFLTRLPGT